MCLYCKEAWSRKKTEKKPTKINQIFISKKPRNLEICKKKHFYIYK